MVPKPKSSYHACSPFSFVWALALIVITFFCSRLLERPLSGCDPEGKDPAGIARRNEQLGSFEEVFGKSVGWPQQGYGSFLSLRIYVYEEWEINGLKDLQSGRDHNIHPDSCAKGQWGTQVKIHQLLLKSTFRTLRKEEAQLFFVPTYVKCVRMLGGLNDKEINHTFVQVLQQLPYFRRSGGRDHVFVFPSGAGAHLFKDWDIYINRSIFLTPEGDRTDKRGTSAFNTWKDVLIPGNVDDSISSAAAALEDTVRPIQLSQRKHLANFLGRAQGKAGRLHLLQLSQMFPEKLEAPELAFSGPKKLGRREYFEHLRNAKFCLAPRGESSWTLRFYESFFVECVPVILSDEMELPFQNVIDYREFSIKWPSSRISKELLDYLESIPDIDIERMLARGRVVRLASQKDNPLEEKYESLRGGGIMSGHGYAFTNTKDLV
ncbi:hypothetical protein GOP47_0000207 [Adiantum capillus-veneris]|uniref:Exostosin GT47 domain-containing protein n=1 Tax=Adiantum capillus-veneris TaxID=13818 RepID=A0A9D4ZQI2_ADICA|nr:hypothetical protein GOP47_0000207 [Adiantum capillus-veneris]